MQEGQADLEIDGYYRFMNSAIKKGYSGTLIYAKRKPLNVTYGLFKELYNDEGRVITLEYEDFYLVNAYVPNAQPELKRIDFRSEWEEKLLKYLKKLDKKKPIVYCGDLNVAHEEIDLKNPKQNVGQPGFSDEERSMMTTLLSNNFVDVYRELNPNGRDYTWWSYRANARENNVGWRIDYFITSKNIINKVKGAYIYDDIMGSDHAPIGLDIDLK
jgi:exodeoxyribonuclease-3